MNITFDEALDLTLENLPPKSAFVVTADGNPIDVAQAVTITATPKRLLLGALSPSIRSGQVVRVRYTDPTAGDDTRAVQDDDGNDAASFTLGPDAGDVLAVTNNSTLTNPATVPGAPRMLELAEVDATTYTLSWLSPLNWGGSAITGYKIESCESGCESGDRTGRTSWRTPTARTRPTPTAP